jgi:hypothetical protein
MLCDLRLGKRIRWAQENNGVRPNGLSFQGLEALKGAANGSHG